VSEEIFRHSHAVQNEVVVLATEKFNRALERIGINAPGGIGLAGLSGSLYLHSTSYGNQVAISGGASSGTFILGNIDADQVNLSGSGVLKMVLNPSASTDLLKVSIFH